MNTQSELNTVLSYFVAVYLAAQVETNLHLGMLGKSFNRLGKKSSV